MESQKEFNLVTLKWHQWVNKYGIENVRFVVGEKDHMYTNGRRYGYDDMIESYEDALNEIEL